MEQLPAYIYYFINDYCVHEYKVIKRAHVYVTHMNKHILINLYTHVLTLTHTQTNAHTSVHTHKYLREYTHIGLYV